VLKKLFGVSSKLRLISVVNVELILVIIKHHAMKLYGGVGV
jgi:hypothetical protein